MKLLQVISTKSNITLIQEYVISDIFEPIDFKKNMLGLSCTLYFCIFVLRICVAI